MITSKKEYLYYLKCDAIAQHRDYEKPRFMHDNIWKFQILMRKCEYYENCKKGFYSRIILKWLKFKYVFFGQFLGFSIPLNVFGPGLCIEHYGPIVVNSNASIGSNCRIHEGTTIGANGLNSFTAPQIGNNVYIASGAKIIGSVKVANGIVIGANAVVTKDFTEENITIAGVPAKKISNNDSKVHLIKATEIFDSL